MKKFTRTEKVLIALSTTALLMACGGGGGSAGDTSPPNVPSAPDEDV